MQYFFQYRQDGSVVSYSENKLKVDGLQQIRLDVTDEQRDALLQNPIVNIVNAQLVIRTNDAKQAKKDFIQKVKNGDVSVTDIVTLLEKTVV